MSAAKAPKDQRLCACGRISRWRGETGDWSRRSQHMQLFQAGAFILERARLRLYLWRAVVEAEIVKHILEGPIFLEETEALLGLN